MGSSAHSFTDSWEVGQTGCNIEKIKPCTKTNEATCLYCIQYVLSYWTKKKKTHSKSLLLSHHHSTSALVSEILMSVLQTVQKKQQQLFTYGQYIFTDCTEDNVQNTDTYTQYT